MLEKLGLCEMLIEAQNGDVFYADLANHECAGPVPLGMVEMDPFYEVIPKLAKGSCNYTAFAPLDKLTFDPDVLVLSGPVRKMEIVLRSFSYTTGAMYEYMKWVLPSYTEGRDNYNERFKRVTGQV